MSFHLPLGIQQSFKVSAGFSVLALSICLPARPVQAQEIFNDIPGNTFFHNEEALVRNDREVEAWATAFTPNGNYTFGSVTAPLQLAFGQNLATMELRADNYGQPGTILESITLADQLAPPTASSVNPNFVTFASSVSPTLTAGNQYWIDFIAPAPGEAYTWSINTARTLRPVSVSNNQGLSWQQTQADNGEGINVRGPAAVPESSTIVSLSGLLTLGLGSLLLRTCKREIGSSK